MTVKQAIESKLREALAPQHLEVLDETGMHNVPVDSESHFRVRVVSPAFEGQRLVQRHRSVHQVLGQELAGPIHALAVEALTPAEWRERGSAVRQSPDCLGGDAGQRRT